jgi:hypothetical protein
MRTERGECTYRRGCESSWCSAPGCLPARCAAPGWNEETRRCGQSRLCARLGSQPRNQSQAPIARVCLEIATAPWPNSYSDLSPRGGGPTYRCRYGEPNESPPARSHAGASTIRFPSRQPAPSPWSSTLGQWHTSIEQRRSDPQRPLTAPDPADDVDSVRQSCQAIAALFLTTLPPWRPLRQASRHLMLYIPLVLQCKTCSIHSTSTQQRQLHKHTTYYYASHPSNSP